MKPFNKILIANRGEIACRVIRTARAMGVQTVAVYSDADARAQHVALADEAVHIGASAVSESYLKGDVIIAAALATGAQAIHPGYGFLSENPGFVEAVEKAGLVFIGPSASAIRAMGLKDAAKALMQTAGVPVVPGYHGENQDPAFLAEQADAIGYPVLIKARAGGGGKGMRKVDQPDAFAAGLASAQREGVSAFGDGHVLIEKFITSPRHIEVQVFGDKHGSAVHLFERDCSLQRRHQKVIEEAPAPGMTPEVREAMTSAAVTAAKAINYAGAGTIEFIVDGSGPLRPDGFWFMEMNTRLQVEHPVTEAITGVDLVEWQLRVAAGGPLPRAQDELTISGHAFEARLYAEDPSNGFLPATGTLHHLSFHDAARNDTGVRSGDDISPWYDPMIAKIITHGATREEALGRLRTALAQTHVAGTVTNAGFLASLAAHEGFNACHFDTGLIERDLESLCNAEPLSEAHIAFAALVALDIPLDTPAATTRPGWRLWGEARSELLMFFGADLIERSLTINGDGSITLSGGEASVTLSDILRDGDLMSARTGAHSARIVARVIRADLGARRLVSVLCDGVTRDLIFPDARSGQAARADTSNAVVAPMTGVVIQLLVQVGDAVKEGDTLGVIEAMKMETTLRAPRDGTIISVACTVGAAVEGGLVLVTFEEQVAE
ncbi:3-methylcrotonyl-CoA carboxylase alpha subunit [Puniceibacterium sediminis]|uniref:3-methylcrotonyl-CoA carboxylase alpha subunit n=2 Tax=Puniceibacterium sediminis TaxID=1608407 RepID=A0A238VGM6_9RHOB|nr:3-methylcrotonyl-CoA carboxylase alpha subunit [Puniceibacterium sediminis]